MQLLSIGLPPPSDVGARPVLPPETYEARVAAVRERMRMAGLTTLLVYADREHYANCSYLTGFDPRFEEAVVVVGLAGPLRVITGNESVVFARQAEFEVDPILCQSFSPPGQDRSRRARLADALGEAGVRRSDRVGVVGWRAIAPSEAPNARYALAVPQFVVSEIESVVDEPIVDATTFLLGLDGLRATCEADQLALHEYQATRASQAVWRALEQIRVGVSELELSAALRLDGSPLACHVLCASADGGLDGRYSPTDRRLALHDRFAASVGYWGGLTCRAGVVATADDPHVDAYVERFAAPFYRAVRVWYEQLRIGARAADVSAAVDASLSSSTVRPTLPSGHLIHLEEWFDTPFTAGSDTLLRSGMGIQCDIIPASDAFPDDVANVEDALALADADLRAEMAERYPEAWRRIQARRTTMTDVLGIDLAEEVLPFSDRQAILPPALLSPSVALVPERA